MQTHRWYLISLMPFKIGLSVCLKFQLMEATYLLMFVWLNWVELLVITYTLWILVCWCLFIEGFVAYIEYIGFNQETLNLCHLWRLCVSSSFELVSSIGKLFQALLLIPLLMNSLPDLFYGLCRCWKFLSSACQPCSCDWCSRWTGTLYLCLFNVLKISIWFFNW